MANLKELLGTAYKEGMTVEEADAALGNKRFADVSTGEYVSRVKYDADTKLLNDYKAQIDNKQAEIDAAVAKAQAAAKTEYEKQLASERTADKRKRAKEKAYEGLTDEQKGVYDAFLKADDLKLSEDGESFSNFDELAKPIREKYPTLFPVSDGSLNRAGLAPAPDRATPPTSGDPFGFGFIERANANKSNK